MKLSVSIGILAILITSSLPVKSQTLLNYNQPYKNTGKEEEPFLKVEDNDDMWNMIIEIRNRKVGYEDTEFINKVNFCRYVGESVVLQKKLDFYLEHVVDYSTRCMKTQTNMIKHFMKNDYHDENDIEDTKRALKYFRKGYTNSVYYPPNSYNDNFEKIDRKFSFYDEVYSIFRFFILSNQIRGKIKQFIENRVDLNIKSKLEKLKIIPKHNRLDTHTFKLINYDNTCIIRANVLKGNRVFDQNKTRDIANEINKILQLINFEKTNVFFSYNPSVNTIYNLKLNKDKYILKMSNEQKLSSKNFSSFFKEKKIHYIDLSNDIRKIAATRPLHPCNGEDSHLSVDGYKLYSKLLTDKINSILKEKK